jgi:hypothetical protein
MCPRLIAKLVLLGGVAISLPANARTTISPYLEVDQSVFAPLSGGKDVIGTTSVAAGVDATITGNRTQAQIDLRVQRDFGEYRGASKAVTASGLARVDYQLVPHVLSLDVGGIATRTRTDIRGNALSTNNANYTNLSQTYSAYAGPSLTTHAGSLGINASYRAGYTKVNTTTPSVLPTGQPTLDTFDSSITQIAQASVGMKTGILPFGWTVSGLYAQDDARQLDQRLVQKHVRGDVTLPLTPTVAAVGGVGYEQVKASERNAVVDANNIPIVDANGRYQTDKASPRLAYYDVSGLYWDAGVLYRPTAHTSIEARVGRRYNSWSYTGSLSSALSDATSVRLSVYDEIDTFGSQLNNGVAALPTSFTAVQNPFSGQNGSCVYGGANGGSGGCLANALQSTSSEVYRARGVTGVFSSRHGPWSYGVAAGYSRRNYLTPRTGIGSTLNGISDQSAFAQAYFSRKLTPESEFDTNFYANWFKSGILGAPTVTSFGASGTYARSFGNHLSGSASLGVFSADEQGIQEAISASALLGLRYRF